MIHALTALVGGALLVLLIGLGKTPDPAMSAGLGVVFAAAAVVGFRFVRRRGKPATAVYFVTQLVLGYALFGVAGAAVGAQLMLLVLVVQAVLLLPAVWAAVVALLIPLAHLGMSWAEFVQEGTSTFVAALFAYVLTMMHVREHRHAEEVADLAATRERNRMARDIHDGLGHHLTVVQMQLQAARAVLASDPERAAELLEKAQQQSTAALADVRRSVAALRETTPLPDALRRLASESSEAGVPTTVEVLGTRRALPPDWEDSLYRVAQEGLTNVRKHAQASGARVLLDYGSPVRLEVHDDGHGTDPVADKGFGLVGLRERVTGLGGSLHVDSTAGAGLTLRVELPG